MIQDINARELPDAESTKMGMANTGETIDVLNNDVADYGSNAHWDRVGIHERIETGPKAGEETGTITIAHIIDFTNGKPTAETTTETVDLPLPPANSIFQTSDLLRLNKPSTATGGSDNFNASVQTAFGIPSRADRSSGKLKVVNPVDTDTASNPFISLTRAISVAAVQGMGLSTLDVGSLPIGTGQVSLPMSVYERSDKTKDVVAGRFGEYFIVSHLRTEVHTTGTNVSDAKIGILSWTAMVKRFGADGATRIASSVSQFGDRNSAFATNSRTGQISLSTENDSLTNQLLTELSSSSKASIYLPDRNIFIPQAIPVATGNFISYIHDEDLHTITAVEKTPSGVEKVKNVWDLTKNAWVDVKTPAAPTTTAVPAAGEGGVVEANSTRIEVDFSADPKFNLKLSDGAAERIQTQLITNLALSPNLQVALGIGSAEELSAYLVANSNELPPNIAIIPQHPENLSSDRVEYQTIGSLNYGSPLNLSSIQIEIARGVGGGPVDGALYTGSTGSSDIGRFGFLAEIGPDNNLKVTVFVDPPNLSDPRAIPEYNKRFMNFIYTLANAGVPDSEGGAKGYMNAYIKANALPDALTYRPTGSPPLYSFFTLNNQ